MNHFATTMLAFEIMLLALPAAHAAQTTCPPNPSPGATVDGNLLVPPGTNCTLTSVTVTGNVDVQTNATLSIEPNATQGSTIEGNVHVGTRGVLTVGPSAEPASTIDGNVEADQCLTVGMNTAIVGGNVRIQNCTIQSGYEDAKIGGNFACNNNSAACVARNGNVYGNVQINDNLSAEVFSNTIGGNLQCEGNTTISGGGNMVGGHQQGQCAGF